MRKTLQIIVTHIFSTLSSFFTRKKTNQQRRLFCSEIDVRNKSILRNSFAENIKIFDGPITIQVLTKTVRFTVTHLYVYLYPSWK